MEKEYNYNGARIWVADDNEHLREALTKLLRIFGAETREFKDPAQLNNLLGEAASGKEPLPDLIVSDYTFSPTPMNIYEAWREDGIEDGSAGEICVAMDRLHLDIPMIVLTGATQVTSMNLRGGKLLEKPIPLEEIIKSIEQVLAQKKQSISSLVNPKKGKGREDR